mmetsp:Transcript_4924/g.9763  ORF Transcript_4924/g.9763 Transcript_4924/m.9763 type:complete len:613 (-) Transcript_4924:38-1876(-)
MPRFSFPWSRLTLKKKNSSSSNSSSSTQSPETSTPKIDCERTRSTLSMEDKDTDSRVIRSSPEPLRKMKHSSPDQPLKSVLNNVSENRLVGGAVPCTYKREYELRRSLGEGSFGQVLLAKWVTKNQRVALKVLKEESVFESQLADCGVTYKDIVAAFEQEIVLMESVGAHPNVVEILAKGYDGRMLAMEVASSDIYHIVKKVGPGLPLALCKRWSKQVLAAVDFIHSKGVFHQDIKSSNILIFDDGTAKVCDFGLAVKGEGELRIDRELLTLWYRAPELIMGSRIYNNKVDEWGVGCVMLEMLIGHVAFPGNSNKGCTCNRVSHVNYNSDQISRIYQMIGTPATVDMESMACYCHVKSWPKCASKLKATIREACRGRGGLYSPMSSVSLAASAKIRDASATKRAMSTEDSRYEEDEAAEYMLDTISRLLCFKPKSRDTAAMALEGPLFTSCLPSSARHNAAVGLFSRAKSCEEVTTGGNVMTHTRQTLEPVGSDEVQRKLASCSLVGVDKVSPKETITSPAASSASTKGHPHSRAPSEPGCCSESQTPSSRLSLPSRQVSPPSRHSRESARGSRHVSPPSRLSTEALEGSGGEQPEGLLGRWLMEGRRNNGV